MKYLINITKTLSGPHKHKNYELIAYVEGKGVVVAGDRTYKVYPGCILIIPPETTHYNLKADDKFKRIYINGDFNQIFSFDSPELVVDNSANEGMMLIKAIYANRYTNPDYVLALINAFAHFLLQNIKIESKIFLAIKDIIDRISIDFPDSCLNVEDMLKDSGYAEDYIRAQFKKITGKTPNQLLTEIRINHARYLIGIYTNSIPLSEIAEKCGYTDYIYFSRRFKQITGISPREYREERLLK